MEELISGGYIESCAGFIESEDEESSYNNNSQQLEKDRPHCSHDASAKLISSPQLQNGTNSILSKEPTPQTILSQDGKQYAMGHSVGNGCFGKVFILDKSLSSYSDINKILLNQIKHKKNVIKIMPYGSAEEKRIAENELNIVKYLSQIKKDGWENSIMMAQEYGIGKDNHGNAVAYLVMPYAELGSLSDLLKTLDNISNERLREKIKLFLCKVLSEIVLILHRLGICHFDLKLDNFLVEAINGEIRIKITDFGFSLILKPDEDWLPVYDESGKIIIANGETRYFPDDLQNILAGDISERNLSLKYSGKDRDTEALAWLMLEIVLEQRLRTIKKSSDRSKCDFKAMQSFREALKGQLAEKAEKNALAKIVLDLLQGNLSLEAANAQLCQKMQGENYSLKGMTEEIFKCICKSEAAMKKEQTTAASLSPAFRKSKRLSEFPKIDFHHYSKLFDDWISAVSRSLAEKKANTQSLLKLIRNYFLLHKDNWKEMHRFMPIPQKAALRKSLSDSFIGDFEYYRCIPGEMVIKETLPYYAPADPNVTNFLLSKAFCDEIRNSSGDLKLDCWEATDLSGKDFEVLKCFIQKMVQSEPSLLKQLISIRQEYPRQEYPDKKRSIENIDSVLKASHPKNIGKSALRRSADWETLARPKSPGPCFGRIALTQSSGD